MIEILDRYTGAVLRTVDAETLTGAHLRWAHLANANLRGADISGADLWFADLRRADLRGARLFGADLTGADLSGADLTGAQVDEWDLKGARLYKTTLPDGTLYDPPPVPPDNAFIRACRGDDPDVTALEWFSALIHEVDAQAGAIPTEDREALIAALRHSQTLLTRLRDAMQQTREVAL